MEVPETVVTPLQQQYLKIPQHLFLSMRIRKPGLKWVMKSAEQKRKVMQELL